MNYKQFTGKVHNRDDFNPRDFIDFDEPDSEADEVLKKFKVSHLKVSKSKT